MTTHATSKVELLETDVIYRNPLPGHQAVAITHPFVHPLSETELICTYKHGQAQYAADNMVHISRSTDGGRTWQHEGPFRDRKKDPVPYQYSAACVTALRDGSLLMLNWRCDRSHPDKLYVNPKTGGHQPLEGAYFRSADAGRTWSEPVIGRFPAAAEGMTHALGGPVIELADGRWMQLSEPWLSYDSTQPYDVRAYVMMSEDEGRTWGPQIKIANRNADGRAFSHGHIIHLPDGRLYALYWTMSTDMTEFHGLSYNMSTDETGAVWTAPQPTGIPGQSSFPVAIDDQRLAIIYSERDSPAPGIKVVLSEDAGRTWDIGNAAVVWDAYGEEALGVPMTDTYPCSHDAIAYGAPHLGRLNNHELIATFWCTQSADTHVRFARLKIS